MFAVQNNNIPAQRNAPEMIAFGRVWSVEEITTIQAIITVVAIAILAPEVFEFTGKLARLIFPIWYIAHTWPEPEQPIQEV